MKGLLYYIAIVLSVLSVISLTACSDDDDIDTVYHWDYSVVGEWYQDIGVQTDEMQQICVSKFNDDGTFSGLIASATIRDWYYFPAEGTYRIEGNQFYETYTMFDETVTDVYEVKSVGKYDMLLYNRLGESEDFSHRIVETFHLKVGETEELWVNDPDFIPMEYYSNDDRIATISETGTIEAVRAGTAYLSAVSSIGTAVVRVVVTNPVTSIDDFMAYFGEDISVATNAYGNMYKDLSLKDDTTLTMRLYNLIDDHVQEVGFIYDPSGIVEDIRFIVRDSALVDELLMTYDKIYDYRAVYKDIFYFQAKKYGRDVAVAVQTSYGLVELFYEQETDPIAAVDKLFYMTATEAAEALGHELTENELSAGRFSVALDNSIFWGITVSFNKETLEVTSLYLYARDNVTYNDIDSWYAQHYTATGSTGFQYGRIDPVTLSTVMIMITGTDGSVSIAYIKL